MAASLTTNYMFNLNTYQERVWSFTSDDSGDWVVLDVPGIVAPSITGDTGAALSMTYATLNVHNKSTAYTATDTSIIYNEASPASMTRATGGFYVMASTGDEIMYVQNDSGYTADTGRLTVVRGALGTTAAAASVADDVVLNVLNVVVTGADIDGRAFLRGVVLPSDPKVNMFGAAKR